MRVNGHSVSTGRALRLGHRASAENKPEVARMGGLVWRPCLSGRISADG